MDNPEQALLKLLDITKPGGKIYLSSLFNLEFDVDIYSQVTDYSQKSGEDNIPFSYNTYSKFTIDNWLKGRVKSHVIHEFIPEIDFEYQGRGIGTHTKKVNDNRRLQFSGGMLMNWGVLEISK